MRRRFYTLDVFTEEPLAGNPLAVVLDCEGLDDARMQRIAREFNLPETVFVFEPRDPIHSALVRIFTPARELPFAGHPTIGAACLIGEVRAPEIIASQDLRVVLEEEVGAIVCLVRRKGPGALASDFTLPRLLERLEQAPPSKDEIATGLGLTESDIGFDRHIPSLFSAGAPFLFAPMRSLAAIARARPGRTPWTDDGGPATFLYTREVVQEGSAFHARMFGGGWGVPEDPAMGSAAAAFAGVTLAFDRPQDGEHVLAIEQGLEMGRASRIVLGFEVRDAILRSAWIGGSAVIVSSGALDL
jgi:trans-2,3-dihydro-3-hydroxyanthranilate isomerase